VFRPSRRCDPALSNDGGTFTGLASFVHRGDSLDDLAVAGDKIAGLHQDDVSSLFKAPRRDDRGWSTEISVTASSG